MAGSGSIGARGQALRAGILFVASLAACSGAARAAQGGPDTYGYTWRDSGEPGVTFAWEEIGTTGTEITQDGDDLNLGFQALGFPMPYYGGLYNQVAVTSNGWVSLVDGTSTTFTNTRLPAGGSGMGVIAAYWDDLRLTTGTSHVYFQDFGTRAVIEWKGAHDLGDTAALNTFQVILHADGRIVVQYQQILGDRYSCTLGIESPDETDGLTVWYDDPAGVPTASYRVEFLPPVPLPLDLDCSRAAPLACGDRVNGDLAAGVANQDAYRCSLNAYAGREAVYRLDLAAPTQVRFALDTLSGNPDLLLVNACDPNTCIALPGDSGTRTLPAGTWYVVVDCAAGQEGAYRLRVDCNPLASGLDCATAPTLACGDTVTGDLRGGSSAQDAYWCDPRDFSGAEDVHVLDLPGAARVMFDLAAASGAPQLLLLTNCDPNQCQVVPPGASLDLAAGTHALVVESEPGQEGAYTLSTQCLVDSFTFCTDATFQSRPWGTDNGSFLVNGWFYHPGDTHNFALQVDGATATTWSHEGGGCTQFPSVSDGVIPFAGPGFVQWGSPLGTVRMTMSETRAGGCCGLLLQMDVTNTHSAPHYYDFRVYHDTAFGDGNGTCTTGVVDGGPIDVRGTFYYNEVDLKAIGADTCEGQVRMYSAEDTASIRSSYQMLPPNLPHTMEFLDWDDGGVPCTQWSGLVEAESVGNCYEDSSLLLIWRFPEGAGTLAPGETASASYRIGWRCSFACGGCEYPSLSTGSSDISACNDGIRLSWAPAWFPATGGGVYHCYRSTVSFADALVQPPVATGLSSPSWVDPTAVSGTTYYYVVQAESLDYPGCGTGPQVLGSTAELNVGPVTANPDVTPPAISVGSALRATAHTDTTVDFNWQLAPDPGPGEYFVILRSDDRPEGPFSLHATTTGKYWTDPIAPPRFYPTHVWFYDVRVADACGNIATN